MQYLAQSLKASKGERPGNGAFQLHILETGIRLEPIILICEKRYMLLATQLCID